MKNILVTGGAGFIGSNLLLELVKKYPAHNFINLDLLTYAGNLSNLREVENKPNYKFIKADISDAKTVNDVIHSYNIDTIIHLAAESHVDRSILGPEQFVKTNVVGTLNLLQAAKSNWADYEDKRFYHISTDEVYGTLGETGLFTEDTSYDPRSPYSASKAASDHLVRSFYHTYGLPILISNCSNNYGPMQFPEKLIPLMIHNIKNSKALPVYGDGKYTRDWLWVGDHVRAIDLILHRGKIGETYNIGGSNEWKNIDLVHLLCRIMDKKLKRPEGSSASLIKFVKDRLGHDRRYAIDASKVQEKLGWAPRLFMKEGLQKTVDWYIDNEDWLNNVTSGEYQKYYDLQYSLGSV